MGQSHLMSPGSLLFLSVINVLLSWSFVQGDTEGQLRLVNGARPSQGRVEIYHNGTWGTICDDTFDKNASTVVCHQLLYTGTFFTPRTGARYGSGSGHIWLDDFSCTGSEGKLTDCLLKPWGVNDCSHSEDAGVDCDPNRDATIPVQIVGGPDGSQGRVEIQHNGQWGVICDDEWDDKDAAVVCRQKGFTNVYAVPLTSSYFTNGTGVANQVIWLDDVKCVGQEQGLGACDHKPWGTNNCQNNENAGVICLPIPSQSQPVRARLTGGLSQYGGRVEIQVHGLWGTICDDSFDQREAAVICRMLGYRGGTKLGSSQYAGGSGPIWLDDLNCNGTETSIDQCPHHPWGVNDCSHTEDAAVMCQSNVTTPVSVRLVDGSVPTEGRVEVFYNSQWGTICDDSWSVADAAVICRMLKFSFSYAIPMPKAAFGPGLGTIMMDDVNCVGTESTIGDCQFGGWMVSNCNHMEDAGVSCLPAGANITMRLSGGDGPYEGRLEVSHNNTWGTVCDDHFGAHEAAVVCTSLGFNSTGAIALSNAAYGQGSGQIWLDELNCKGTEANLIQCGHAGWGRSDCSHTEDVSVLCPHNGTTGDNTTVRLVAGTVSSAGRVEVFHHIWGTVCDDSWTDRDAQVVCRMLGLPTGDAKARGNAFFGRGVLPILLDDVKCGGSEMSLGECPHSSWTVNNCEHSEDAGVVCQDAVPSVKVRLVNGTSTSNGRVEVFYNNTWGTICDNRFQQNEASVICHMLGFERLGSVAMGSAHFGQGSGPILLDNVKCVGNEGNIAQCNNNGWYITHCHHSNDVSVVCSTDIPKLRLTGGPSSSQGRLEVEIGGIWGTVCDDLFTYSAAAVVCRQMNLPYTAAIALGGAPYGSGTGKIWLDDVKCAGNETTLFDCRHNALGQSDCQHSEDISIFCRASSSTAPITARLVNGSSPTEGRLEVFINGLWGSVCDDGFSTSIARVACRMLGLPTSYPSYHGAARYGEGSGPIWIDDLACTGSETTLANCSHNAFGIGDCQHNEDVGVSCPTAASMAVTIRLAGGNSHNGRVEVQRLGSWGTVCDDGWDIRAADVVCRQLGLTSFIGIPLANAYYGRGTGSILIDDINCNGTETNIGNCVHKPWGSNNCDHGEDAGVMCIQGNQSPAPVEVRLAGGRTRYQGRVEIKYRGVWGTVCDDEFQRSEANVVCRMLGYGSSGVKLSAGTGRGPIWMDDLACTGSEPSLVNCSFPGWGQHDCDHSEDVGVRCTSPPTPSLPLRIVGGPSPMEGRVEVMYNSQWGTICDNHWTSTEAQVVCRQAGFSTDNATSVGGAVYGRGQGSVVLDNVRCVGTEANLTLCNIGSLGTSSCDHSHDAGVRCQKAGSVTSLYKVRLVNGNTANEGRVEVQIGGQWGTVCDDSWDSHDATVVCRMLKLPTTKVYARRGGYFPSGSGLIQLDDVSCLGTETSLSQCGHAGIGVTNCHHNQDAGVMCGETINHSPIRLAGGLSQYEGRVEIFHSGRWGSVCDDSFSTDNAMVVCRSLGFPVSTARMYRQAHFGAGTGPIWLDDIRCIGDEMFLEECAIRGWGLTDCHHDEDVGVMCTVPTASVRLVNGGPYISQGRVEIYLNGTWGTVCSDLWSNRDAAVICVMLGYSRNNAVAVVDQRFGRGGGRILFDDVGCLGNEASILQCPAKTVAQIRCTHARDAGVICQTSTVTVRLVGSSRSEEGRVEVYYNNTWGTVCDSHFTNLNARVICRMLNKPFSGAYYLPRAHFGPGSGPVLLDGLQCLGSEGSVAQCVHRPWNTSPCSHTHDVSVVCTSAPGITSSTTTLHTPFSTPLPSQTFVRLVGGPTSFQGRVEVFAFNSWGTVCDNRWTTSDAAVVCSMLGYTGFSSGGSIQGQAAYGQGTGAIWLDSLSCRGSETSITQCPVGGWGAHGCGHNRDVGVTCPSGQLPNNFMLMTDSTSKKIYRMDGRTFSYVEIPLSSNNNPIAVDYDSLNGRVVWTDVGSKQIRSATLSGTEQKVIRQLNKVAVPDGIAVDPVTRLIFYTDTGNDIIGLITIDGFAHLSIISSGLDQPRAIVADPSSGLIYWTDWGHNARIERASYDGSGRTPLVVTGLVWPNGIAINANGNELFWCDGNTGKIEKSRLDGSRRTTLATGQSSQYFGLVYFNDYLYYTDWRKHSIYRMNDDGSGVIPEGPATFGRLNDIHYHRDGWGPTGSNACTNGRGGCSHICLPNPDKGFFCVCPDGLTLQPNGLTCGTTKPCPALSVPKYGSVSPNNCSSLQAQVGTQCTVTCSPGFTLLGPSNLQCTSNGQWNNLGLPLLCRDTQGPSITCPTDIAIKAPKGQQTASVTWSTPVGTDNSGGSVKVYQSMSSPVSLSGGQYTVRVSAMDTSGLTSVCTFNIVVTVLTCPNLTPPANAYIASAVCHSYYGSSCSIACRQGYVLSGSKDITCDISGSGGVQWTLNGVSCVAVTCLAPTSPVQGQLTSCTAPYTYQSVCQQSCNPGYQASTGTVIRKCQQDGTWSGEQLVCTQAQSHSGGVILNSSCPALTPPENGAIAPPQCTGPAPAPGTHCTLTCNSGYQSVAGTSLTCSSNGYWNPYGRPLLCTATLQSIGALKGQQSSDSSTPIVLGAVFGIIIVAFIIAGGLLIHFNMRRRPRPGSTGVYEMGSRNSSHGIDNPLFSNRQDSES